LVCSIIDIGHLLEDGCHGGIYIELSFDIKVSKYFFSEGSMSMEEIIIEFLLLLVICAGS
jgi:hypothetical protein